MKRLASVLIVAGILAQSPDTFAQSGPGGEPVYEGGYISGHLGFNSRPDARSSGSGRFDFDPGLTFGGAFGLETRYLFRMEFEIAYRSNNANVPGVDWSFSTLSLMGNVYLDFPTHSPIRPYMGMGIGSALAETTLDTGFMVTSDTEAVLALQWMGGLNFDVSPGLTFTLGYRYFTTTDPYFSLSVGDLHTEIQSHEFLLGARFRF